MRPRYVGREQISPLNALCATGFLTECFSQSGARSVWVFRQGRAILRAESDIPDGFRKLCLFTIQDAVVAGGCSVLRSRDRLAQIERSLYRDVHEFGKQLRCYALQIECDRCGRAIFAHEEDARAVQLVDQLELAFALGQVKAVVHGALTCTALALHFISGSVDDAPCER
jgi:hypothetical protein